MVFQTVMILRPFSSASWFTNCILRCSCENNNFIEYNGQCIKVFDERAISNSEVSLCINLYLNIKEAEAEANYYYLILLLSLVLFYYYLLPLLSQLLLHYHYYYYHYYYYQLSLLLLSIIIIIIINYHYYY